MAPKKQPKSDEATSGVKRERATKEEEQKKKSQKADDGKTQGSLFKYFGGGPKLPEAKPDSASASTKTDEPMAPPESEKPPSPETSAPTPVAQQSASVDTAAKGSNSAPADQKPQVELPIASQASPEPKVSGGLTDEQKSRIEANKKKAMDRKRKLEEEKAASPDKEKESPQAPAEATEPAEAPKSAADEQKSRIEANRKKAMDRKRKLEEEKAASLDKEKEPPQAPAEATEPAEAPKSAPAPKASHPMFSPMRREDKASTKAPPSAKATPKPKRAAAQNTSSNSAAAAPAPPALLKEVAKTPEKTATPEKRETVEPKTHAAIPDGRAGRFMAGAHTQWTQFHPVYAGRLNGLREATMSKAKAMWGKAAIAPYFALQLKDYNNRNDPGEVVIVGTLCKDMKKRPDTLADFKFRIGSVFGPMSTDLVYGENLCSEDDSVTVEDETLKVEVDMLPERVAQLCTGMVVGLKGNVLPNGKFEVSDICFPGLVAPALPPPSQSSSGTVALISGMEFPIAETDAASSDKKPAVERLIEWFQQEHAKGSVSRLIVCGGTMSEKTLKDKATRLAAVTEADEFYSRLAEILPIELMPSRSDPTNLSLPQRPMNPGLFKRTRQMKDFKCVTNPFETDIEGLRFLGHGGDPVKDVLRCTHIATAIEALETCLDARHMAPTAPDTLESAPSQSVDPFVIDEVPHVMFSGGHPKAEHKWCSAPGSADGVGTLCVCVPAFSSHPAVVTVGIRDPRNVTVHEI